MVEAFHTPYSYPTGNPTLSDLLRMHKRDISLGLSCHHLGTIKTFNATNQTATATINYKQTVYKPSENGKVYKPQLVDYPLLMDCPVIFAGGGASYLTFPVKPGDECIILFNDRDIDNWFSGSSDSQPATPRSHAFSDGIILVGVRSLAKSIQNFESEKVCFRNADAKFLLSGDKIELSNATQNLNNLLQDLIDNVKDLVSATASITVTCASPGSPSTPPINSASINAAASSLSTTANKIAELLE